MRSFPTAFMASYGSGKPVIAVMGEFDALPGLSQTASPVREIREGVNASHACGHHLFGTASMAAAIAIKDWLNSSGTQGTIRFYGTPAEEGGAGKVYMVRDGFFKDVDIALHWHPGAENSANTETSNANKSAKFRFYGVSSHAAGSPENGRSALDGVEAMNMMVNMMREHISQESRIHYVITSGGSAPNVVPDFAEVFYYVRHPKPDQALEMFERVVKAAEGAAIGTGTRMEYKIIHGALSLLPNRYLQKIMHDNLTAIGGFKYSVEEQVFAEKIYATLSKNNAQVGDQENIQAMRDNHTYGSTDVGDVSWNVPTAGISTATWVPGTSAHSWQAVAAGGMSIGHKGMQLAAKTLTLTAIDLYKNPEHIKKAKEEFKKRRSDFKYTPFIGNQTPPLDYRENPK